jgi:hypothetical protein
VTLTPEQALKIARFCWPERAWQQDTMGHDPIFVWWDQPADARGKIEEGQAWHPEDETCLAAAERALVERGRGDRYGKFLLEEIGYDRWQLRPLTGDSCASIRAAPPEAIARAILRVAEEQEGIPAPDRDGRPKEGQP